MPKAYPRSPRLKDFDYLGPLAAHVIVVTRLRQPIFADPTLAETVVTQLLAAAARYNAIVHAYCCMADHLHMLIEVPEGVSLQRLVRWFKQMSGFQLKQALGTEAWQISYYDHILRKEEAIEDIARYIWQNPVTAGLVEDWTEFPFSGPRYRLDEERGSQV
jgi:REP element-mobilizing transposase RayT